MPLEKSGFIWMNRKFVPWDEAKIHILSHVVHYGTAVFEGLRCYKTSNSGCLVGVQINYHEILNASFEMTKDILEMG